METVALQVRVEGSTFHPLIPKNSKRSEHVPTATGIMKTGESVKVDVAVLFSNLQLAGVSMVTRKELVGSG